MTLALRQLRAEVTGALKPGETLVLAKKVMAPQGPNSPQVVEVELVVANIPYQVQKRSAETGAAYQEVRGNVQIASRTRTYNINAQTRQRIMVSEQTIALKPEAVLVAQRAYNQRLQRQQRPIPRTRPVQYTIEDALRQHFPDLTRKELSDRATQAIEELLRQDQPQQMGFGR